MKRLNIDLDQRWVKQYIGEPGHPAQVISQVLGDVDGVIITLQSHQRVKLSFDDSLVSIEQIELMLEQKLVPQFRLGPGELEELMTLTVSDRKPSAEPLKPQAEEPPQAQQSEAPAEEETEDEAAAQEEAAPQQAEMVPAPGQPEAPERPRSEPADPCAAIQKIHELKGAQQLIDLCDQLCAMAPLLKKHQLSEVVVRRNYLFSIDSGCGLTTSLSLLAQLVRELELFPAKPDSTIEERLDAPNPRGNVLKEPGELLSRARNKLVCIDISDWTDQLTTPEFRDMLTALYNNTEQAIYVFRVPYLEQETLRRITAAISDVMLIQPVAFVPLTGAEFQEIAAEKLKDYGFTAQPGAWDQFQRRLAEEKSDGRFYGINTVRKIVDEMLFQKMQAILVSGEDNTEITAQDMKYLVGDTKSQLSAQEMLDNLIGVEAIRTRLEEIVAQIEYARKTQGVKAPAMHMQFVGNPGTGKTTVARIVGQMLKERGILSNGYFFEHSGGDFIGMYVGHTAPKTLALCRDAYGSVLFIDEAYTLSDASYSNGDGFAKEAIDTLIAQMENHREDLVIILAGYPKEMEQLMQLNPGLKGRIPYLLEFPNYNRQELCAIFMQMVRTGGFLDGPGLAESAERYFHDLPDSLLESQDFANARFVRNLFERAWSKTVMRTQMDGSDPRVITVEDFEASIQESAKSLSEKSIKRNPIGFRMAAE